MTIEQLLNQQISLHSIGCFIYTNKIALIAIYCILSQYVGYCLIRKGNANSNSNSNDVRKEDELVFDLLIIIFTSPIFIPFYLIGTILHKFAEFIDLKGNKLK